MSGETGGGVIVLTGNAAIQLRRRHPLEAIPISRFEAVARLVRPLPPETRLPARRFDTRPLLAACGERTTV